MTIKYTDVPLTPSQIRFMLDTMMGCPARYTKQYSAHYNTDAAELYNHLLSQLNNDHTRRSQLRQHVV